MSDQELERRVEVHNIIIQRAADLVLRSGTGVSLELFGLTIYQLEDGAIAVDYKDVPLIESSKRSEKTYRTFNDIDGAISYFIELRVRYQLGFDFEVAIGS